MLFERAAVRSIKVCDSFYLISSKSWKFCPLWLINMSPVCQRGLLQGGLCSSEWLFCRCHIFTPPNCHVLLRSPTCCVFSRLTHSFSVDSFTQSLASLLIADYFLPLIFPPLWLSATPWLVSPVPRLAPSVYLACAPSLSLNLAQHPSFSPLRL